MDLTPTPSQTVGPYLHLGLTDARSISRIASEGVKGERVWLTFRVLDGDGVPVPDAMIELWQADSEGNYAHRTAARTVESSVALGDWRRRKMAPARLKLSSPDACPGRAKQLQAPHINVSILGRGILKRLSTRVYFAGDPRTLQIRIGLGARKSARDVVGPAGSGTHGQLDLRRPPSGRRRDGVLRCVIIMCKHDV